MAHGFGAAEQALRAIAVPTTNPYYPAGAPAGLRISYDMGVEHPSRVNSGELAERYAFGFTDDTLLYGFYARGYKAGGLNPAFSPGIGIVPISPTFKPEFIDSFEFGTKNTLLNGTLQMNLGGMGQFRGHRSIDVLDWTGNLTGAFSTLQLPSLGGNLTWDTSELYSSGVLTLTGSNSYGGGFRLPS